MSDREGMAIIVGAILVTLISLIGLGISEHMSRTCVQRGFKQGYKVEEIKQVCF